MFGCNCGVLTATTQKLDEIIAEGLESGELLIPHLVGRLPGLIVCCDILSLQTLPLQS